MCKTHQIAEELGVEVKQQMRGSERIDIFTGMLHQVAVGRDASKCPELKDGTYLVEKDGQRFVLKTGKINPQEIKDNQLLEDRFIRVRKVVKAEPGSYILYEFIDAQPLSAKDFWTDENIQRVIDLQNEIREVLSDQVPSTGANRDAVAWLRAKVDTEWLPLLVPSIISQETADTILNIVKKYVDNGFQLSCIYRDNNADHYLDLGDELAVVDVDLVFRPKEYMNMRYLSWVLLKMPPEAWSGSALDWARKWANHLGATSEHYFTWLISLIGILWDIHGNEKTKEENIERTEDIKQILDWVISKLTE